MIKWSRNWSTKRTRNGFKGISKSRRDCKKQRTDVFKIVYAHRVGTVPIMEASIVIAISSPHRKASLEAVHFSIDELKARVPIWKKEIYLHDGVEHQPAWKKMPCSHVFHLKASSNARTYNCFEI